MIPIGEAIQTVQSMYSKGVQSKDSRLSSRQIYSTLLSARSTFIKQQSTKKQFINNWAYQTLLLVELELAPPYEASLATSNGNSVLKSKYKLPTLISGLDKFLFKAVVDFDGTRFDYAEFENVKFLKGNKYTGNKPKFYLKNGYLYITNLKILKGVTVEALFDDPIEVFEFNKKSQPCDECTCKEYYDLEFPIDRDSFRTVAALAEDKLVNIFSQLKQDTKNNARDDNAMQGSMLHSQQPQPTE